MKGFPGEPGRDGRATAFGNKMNSFFVFLMSF